MRQLITIVVLTAALAGVTPGRAQAQTIGPVCVSVDQFSSQFVFYFRSLGANQLLGTGRDYISGTSASATAILTGGDAVLSVVRHIPPTGTGHAYLMTSTVSLATGFGIGYCEAVNTTAGCGTGTPITTHLVACPAAAFADVVPSANDAGRTKLGDPGRDPGQ
jgi:hypothetical protein